MNLIDAIIAAVVAAGAVAGYRAGFIARSASWAGMIVGLVLIARVLPWALESLGTDPSTGGGSMGVAIAMIAAVAAGQGFGMRVGHKTKATLRSVAAQRIDTSAGAVFGLLGALVLVWLVTPMGSDSQGWQGDGLRNSSFVAVMKRSLPPAPDANLTMKRLFGDSYPKVFQGSASHPPLDAKPAPSALSDETLARASRSVVKIEGEACGQIQDGTGWVIGPDLIVTNAHVVAGNTNIDIQRPDGEERSAVLVLFDPEIDIAVLRVQNLGLPNLAVKSAKRGDQGAVLGHPGGGALAESPSVIWDQIEAAGTDIYGHPGPNRQVLVLVAELEPGDSGSPVLNSNGEVVAMAFAVAPDRENVAYALSEKEIFAALLKMSRVAVDSGGCTP